MRTDVKEKQAATVTRQIEFPSKEYRAADDFLANENRRLRNKPNYKKKFIKDILPVLVSYGLKFVNGEVYTPEDSRGVLIKDKRWCELRSKAELAAEEFRDYQNELLQKDADAE